ncbi:MAG TPA: class I SAM-dependent methyltransferase [Patescibacteria group bacterium]
MFEKDEALLHDTSPHSPHNIIPGFIKPGTTLLDVGCNTGNLGKILKKKKVICDGIDINPDFLKKAKRYYRHLFLRDLFNPKLNLEPKLQYDFIVLSDILEHLPRPDLLLIELKKYLKPDGQMIVSLPNVARFEIRLKLLAGKFDYSPGILSPDHLRFFTRESAHQMFKNCDMSVKSTSPTGLGHKIKVLPTLTAFQFIYILVLFSL